MSEDAGMGVLETTGEERAFVVGLAATPLAAP